MSKPKAPLSTDRHVGARIRMRRKMLKMSQEKVGEALGITFQQIQKYEKGTNRIGASRLKQISDVLQVPVAFFFEGVPGPAGSLSDVLWSDHVTEFLKTSDGLTLARSFLGIERPALRRRIVDLVKELGERTDTGF